MDAQEHDAYPRTPLALAVLTALVYAAGFTMVGAWFALLVLGPGPAITPAGALRELSICGVCGVVERVDEFERAALKLSGDAGEGFVVLIAALGGSLNQGGAQQRVYETAVRHDDGSLRVVRDSVAPAWKAGDRVRVLRGQVERDATGFRPSRAAAAPDAVPPGKTASLVLPVVQVP
jgi:hypothetical protein